MRNLKKVLALVIAFSMMLSVVAFAGYNDVAEDADYAGAVELLSALEIIKGDDQGNFNPDNTITRSEMAAIICRALGLESAATGAMGATAFTDVAADHWASGYVNLASQNGIIAGYGDGKFGPEDTLTYEAAVAMIVRALGFEPMAAQKGGWSAGYLVVANTYKITAGADNSATRANVAILMANAMSTPMMDQTTFGADAEFEVLDGKKDRAYKSLLTGMDIYIATGIVGEKNVDEVAFVVKEDSDDLEFEASATEKNFKIGESNVASYKNQMVDAYVKKLSKSKYEVVAVVPAALGETFTLLSDDVDAILTELDEDDNEIEVGLEYYVEGSNKTKDIDFALTSIEYNKNTKDYTTLASIIDPDGTGIVDDIELVFIENDGDNVYDALVATKYESTRIDYVEEAKNKIGYENRNIVLDFEDEEKTIVLRDADGNALTLADFAEDDVVAVVTDGSDYLRYNNYIEIVKLDNATVTGSVDSTWTDNNGVDYVSIDGTEYKNGFKALQLGDEGTFYIGLTGKIIDFEVSSVNSNYGYILEAATTTDFSKTVYQVKLLTAADGVAIYDVDEDIEEDLVNILKTINGWDADENTLEYVREVKVENEEGELVSNEASKNRLVEFEVNSKGLIDEIALAEDAGTLEVVDAEYRADSQRIDGKTLENDVVIMYIDKAKSDDVYTTDLSFLVDEGEYEGYIFKDDLNKENCVMIVTGGKSPFNAEAGIAIATKVSTAKDAEGETVTKVSYVQGETEGVITFTDDAEAVAGAKYDTLALGDAFLFSADGEGVVNSYEIIATYAADGFVLADGVAADYLAGDYGDDAEIGVGYLYHYIKGNKAGTAYIADGKTVAAKTDLTEISIATGAFQYTYNNFGRNSKIEIGDYLATENTEYWSTKTEEGKATATPVLYVTIDGEVVDIFTANDTVTVTFAAVAGIVD